MRSGPGRLERLRGLLVDEGSRKLLTDAGISTASQLVNSLLGIVRSALAARYLGVADFGRLALVLSGTTLVSRLASVRLWEWVTVNLSKAFASGSTQEVAAVRKAGHLLGIVIHGAALLVVMALAPWLAVSVLHEPSIEPLLQVNAFLLVSQCLDETSTATLRVLGKYRWLAAFGACAAILRLLLTVIAVVMDLGLLGVIVSAIAAQIVCSVLLWARARSMTTERFGSLPGGDLKLILRDWRSHAKTLFVFSMSDTVKALAADADALIIGHYHPAAVVGQYRAAFTVVQGLHMLATPSYMVLYPEVARAVVSRDASQTRRILVQGTTLGGIGGVVAGTLLALAAPVMVSVAYGSQFGGAVQNLQIMSCSLLVLAVGWANPLFVSAGRSSYTLLMVTVALAAKLGLMLLLVPPLADAGASAAYAASYIVTIAAAVFLGRRVARLLRESTTETRST